MGIVQVSLSAGVARVVLDRPPLNVIDLEGARELAGALESLRSRPDLSAVVLAARGRAFSAGVDVRDHLPDRGAAMLSEFHRACRLLLDIEVPVVAAVQGAALGGGCELTLICDLVWASDRASFGQPEIKLGVFPRSRSWPCPSSFLRAWRARCSSPGEFSPPPRRRAPGSSTAWWIPSRSTPRWTSCSIRSGP